MITVQYGAAIWKIAAALVALIGLVVARGVRTRRAREAARVEVGKRMATFAAPVLAKTEGVATVTGILHGGSASMLLVGTWPYYDRAGELYVDYKGERVELAAPLRVVHGSFAASSRGLPRATPRSIRDAIASGVSPRVRAETTAVSRILHRVAGGSVHRLARISDGDAVVVRGVFGKRGGVDRFGVRTWILEPEPGADAIEIAALSPAAHPVPMRWYAALVLAAALAAGACGAMYALGQHELAVARAAAPEHELRTFDPLALAAALPGSRDEALAEIARRYP